MAGVKCLRTINDDPAGPFHCFIMGLLFLVIGVIAAYAIGGRAGAKTAAAGMWISFSLIVIVKTIQMVS